MPTYEIRKYTGGRWMLDSIFDDKDDAVDEAKSLMERSRSLTAIRVVAVANDETGFKEWTVYKQSIVDGENEQATQRASQVRREVEAARAQRKLEAPPNAKAAPKKPQRSPWLYYAGMAARVLFVIALGAGALILLHRQFL
jgi:ferric-dicitrate binding protein FerR (iron transport regulator)